MDTPRLSTPATSAFSSFLFEDTATTFQDREQADSMQGPDLSMIYLEREVDMGNTLVESTCREDINVCVPISQSTACRVKSVN